MLSSSSETLCSIHTHGNHSDCGALLLSSRDVKRGQTIEANAKDWRVKITLYAVCVFFFGWGWPGSIASELLHFARVADDAKCIAVTRVCVSVCVSVRARMPTLLHGLGCNLGDCPLVVHYWADLQSVHGLRCYGNIMWTRTVGEYTLIVLALWLVSKFTTLSRKLW